MKMAILISALYKFYVEIFLNVCGIPEDSWQQVKPQINLAVLSFWTTFLVQFANQMHH